LGAETHLTSAGARWLTPLPLWTGILAGPVVWATDLTVSYAFVQWSCTTRRFGVLHAITALSLVLVIAGGWIAWQAFQQSRGDVPDDGGRPRQRARFMATVGLASAAFFLLAILANEMPRWVLYACR
jgi:hypothetical protein